MTTVNEVKRAELIGKIGTFSAVLRLKVNLIDASRYPVPNERVIESYEALTLGGARDGDYRLRFRFGGNEIEHKVRVVDGALLSGHSDAPSPSTDG